MNGAGRALRAAYALLALAAGARALVQLATEPDRAPLAYGLSAVAALVYAAIAATIGSPRRRAFVIGACAAELAGVLVVGAYSLTDPGLFPDETVWSDFGAGYGFVPLLLPPIALGWLLRAQPSSGGPPTPISFPSGSR